MLSSVQAGQNTHDDYVKQLLDQRTARTNFHFSTPSDFSDTPSVYSRSFFSPHPQANGGSSSPVNGYTHSSHNHITSGNPTPDDINDSSHDSNREVVDEDYEAEEDFDDESLSHISVLGPKMRFHSRAPWEIEEDTINEGYETVQSPLEYPAKSRFFNLVPSNPRIGKLGRPSAESTCSEVARKLSKEETASKGRSCHSIYSQSKCDRSDTSLGRSCNGGGQDVIQQSPCTRLDQSSSTSTSLPPRSISPNRRPSIDEQTIGCETRWKDDVSFQANSISVEPHPYANPDLMVYTTESDEQPRSFQNPVNLIGSDSTTLTESLLTSSVSKCDTVPSLTRAIAVSVPLLKSSVPTIHGVPISTPLPLGGHAPPLSLPGVQKLPGWMEKANTPSFSLISLEEARAQRAKNTVQAALSDALPNANLNGNPPYPDSANPVLNDQSQHHSTIIQRTRARSVSASTKAKSVLHSAVRMHAKSDKREGELDPQANSVFPPGKSIKHKKSGFMRLLVGNRTSEREERAQLPPVPSLPDIYESQSHPQRTHKKLHRVPVPESSTLDAVNAEDKPNANDINAQLAKSTFSRKHTPPPLSISSTAIKNAARVVGSDIETSPRAQSVLIDSAEPPWMDKALQSAQSAPAHVVDFPALKLRPVSTLFSAHFSEHITKQLSSPEPDTDTPRTSSPVTPRSAGPSIHELTRAVPAAISPEDQSDVIRALQEHIISSKVMWQRQIWKLEGQVRDLKVEVEDLKAAAYCEACGKGKPCNGDSAPDLCPNPQQSKSSVVHRSRTRTGTSSRFGNSIE